MTHKLIIRKGTHQGIAILVVVALAFASAACKKGSSPTTTFQAFYRSFKDKDVEAYKKTVSKSSLQVLESRATAIDKSLDEYIRQEMNRPGITLPDKLETRHEKIEGDHATLEIKNNEGGWNTVPFVKEDGEWKVSVDKL
jgi:hypothetical protein